jgi:hypothetical protein
MIQFAPQSELVPAVTEAPKKTGDGPKIAGKSTTGRVVALPQDTPIPTSSSGRLSAILEWIKPYREIAAILTALIVLISGGIAWVVAHFATRSEVHYLECRVTNNILTQLLPIRLEEFAGKIEWRATQIKVLAQHGGGTPQSIGTIADLTDQMNTLTKEQSNTTKELQKNIEAIAKSCISETPTPGGAP